MAADAHSTHASRPPVCCTPMRMAVKAHRLRLASPGAEVAKIRNWRSPTRVSMSREGRDRAGRKVRDGPGAIDWTGGRGFEKTARRGREGAARGALRTV